MSIVAVWGIAGMHAFTGIIAALMLGSSPLVLMFVGAEWAAPLAVSSLIILVLSSIADDLRKLRLLAEQRAPKD